jgi:hypothetical protein
MTLEEAIKHYEETAEEKEKQAIWLWSKEDNSNYDNCIEVVKKLRQLAEWLSELKEHRDFADWLAHAVLEEDWEEDADFYGEVICRKLTKLGHLKVEDNKYMEVNADEIHG